MPSDPYNLAEAHFGRDVTSTVLGALDPFGAEGKVVYINECTGTVFVLVYDSYDPLHESGTLLRFSDAWGSWDYHDRFKVERFGEGMN